MAPLCGALVGPEQQRLGALAWCFCLALAYRNQHQCKHASKHGQGAQPACFTPPFGPMPPLQLTAGITRAQAVRILPHYLRYRQRDAELAGELGSTLSALGDVQQVRRRAHSICVEHVA